MMNQSDPDKTVERRSGRDRRRKPRIAIIDGERVIIERRARRTDDLAPGGERQGKAHGLLGKFRSLWRIANIVRRG